LIWYDNGMDGEFLRLFRAEAEWGFQRGEVDFIGDFLQDLLETVHDSGLSFVVAHADVVGDLGVGASGQPH